MIRMGIVGLGRIGASNPTVGGVPRSHLAAALATPRIRLVALIDPDPAKRTAAGILAPHAELFADIQDVPAGSLDVLIDARPAQGGRAHIARSASLLGVNAIVFEKPLSGSLEDGLATADAVRSFGLTARVNFHRRFDVRHRAAKAKLGATPVTVSAHFAKGLDNYGSHLIDLILDWMGPIQAVRAAGVAIHDAIDPSIGFDILFSDGRHGEVRVLANVNYDVFEASFYTADSLLEIQNGGTRITLARAKRDLVYPGYTHLSHDPVAVNDTPVAALLELHAELVAHVTTGEALGGATVDDALAGAAIISAVRRSHADGGSWQATSLSSPNA